MSRPPASPDWYKDAVIYQAHVRTFRDGNGDGVGDFTGFTSKLDHLAELGVTAVWLLPFYPSPLRDDGYDIADYTSVNPMYGDLRSFKRFLKTAHERGLRVITEVVMNHTSDQHPWFQRARKAPAGSPERDFYVWNDTPDRWPEARVIFQDFEPSNWSWDPVAQAYFWHRFYSHQPDLNFDHPPVRRAMFEVLDFWLDLGVDGVRLDAVPYLYERDGENGENLPETHAFLKEIRAHVDEKYGDRMLLAEANQWPEDAVEYFGDDDECHMCFHFPVMPRLYMSVRREDRMPIEDILEQTPSIPPSAQWATFLRNHDELTLEMVTDEERDYMYRAYAEDPRMRINLGIRRRLAPLVDNDRQRVELLNGLLFSLPGTPIVYYGDEIGMGDNVYLGDRDGVRTPMQWSPDRNAGFSSASPHRLYLPVVTEPAYHYENVNVETHERSPTSLLWWMRRLIALRRAHPQLARGDIRFLEPDNHKVLAFVRSLPGEPSILVVANLSRHAQAVEIDLAEHVNSVPVELFGRTRFAPVGTLPYYLTLGPHDFFWFLLDPADDEATETDDGPPTLTVRGTWHDLFGGPSRKRLVEVVAPYLRHQRWFAGRGRPIRSVEITRAVPLRPNKSDAYAWLTKVAVDYADGDPERYAIPLTALRGEAAAETITFRPESVVARLVRPDGGDAGVLVDAFADEDTVHAFLRHLARNRRSDDRSDIRSESTPALRRLVRSGPDVHIPRVEQSNTSIIVGDGAVVKLLRRLDVDPHPDVEMSQYLTDRSFPHSPALLGSMTVGLGRDRATLALVHEFVPNEGDAWSHVLDELGLVIEEVLAEPDRRPPALDAPLDLMDREPPREVIDVLGPSLAEIELLGKRVGQLHACLASGEDDEFRPDALGSLSRRSLQQSLRSGIRQGMVDLRSAARSAPDDVAAALATVIGSEPELTARVAELRERAVRAHRIRVHGDLHLGQVLWTGRDFVIVDFEGEPNRPTGARRLKHPALKDVAGMLRSFHYAAATAAGHAVERGLVHEDGPSDRLAQWLRAWETWCASRFLRGWMAEADPGSVPDDRDDLELLLDLYVIDKLIYEVRYELGSRPDWVHIPLDRLVGLVSA